MSRQSPPAPPSLSSSGLDPASLPEAEHVPPLRAALEERGAAYVDLLRRMVEINSFTENREGVRRLAGLTADAFAPLGFEAESVPAEDPAYGDHLVLTRSPRREASGAAGNGPPSIALVSHLDTVFPPEEEEANHFHWREEGDRIYGPGTVDIKGGTVVAFMMLDALRRRLPDLFDSTDWLVLLDSAEERGAADFGTLCRERIGERACRACLVFEGAPFEEGSANVVVARKGIALFEVRVTGRAAHAGSAPEYGASALVQLADVIRAISGWTDLERGLTFNVGTAQGGTVVNRVPHEAVARVEMRAFTPEAYEAGLAHIRELDRFSTVRSLVDDYPCRVSVEILQTKPPWPRNPGSSWVADRFDEAAALVGRTIVREERGGLSDGNETWDSVPTVDGMGPDGGNAHCSEHSADGTKEQEFVDRTSLVPRALLNTLGVLRILAAEGRQP